MQRNRQGKKDRRAERASRIGHMLIQYEKCHAAIYRAYCGKQGEPAVKISPLEAWRIIMRHHPELNSRTLAVRHGLGEAHGAWFQLGYWMYHPAHGSLLRRTVAECFPRYVDQDAEAPGLRMVRKLRWDA